MIIFSGYLPDMPDYPGRKKKRNVSGPYPGGYGPDMPDNIRTVQGSKLEQIDLSPHHANPTISIVFNQKSIISTNLYFEIP